jgi:hypothetical protein
LAKAFSAVTVRSVFAFSSSTSITLRTDDETSAAIFELGCDVTYACMASTVPAFSASRSSARGRSTSRTSSERRPPCDT